MGPLTALPVALPLLVAALLAGLNHAIKRRAALFVAIGASLATLVCCFELIAAPLRILLFTGSAGGNRRHGIALGISFTIDPIGAGLAALAALLVLAALAVFVGNISILSATSIMF